MNLQQKKELIGFTILMLVLSCILSIIMLFVFSSEDKIVTQTITKEEMIHIRESPFSADSTKSILIPVTANYNNQTFHLDAFCSGIPVSTDSWNYIGIDFLDANKEYEYSTELNFWDASGYDDEGHWHETDNNEDFKFVRESKGTFYIKITSVDYDIMPYTIDIIINKRRGSTIVFWIILILSIGAIIYLANYKENLRNRKRGLYYD